MFARSTDKFDFTDVEGRRQKMVGRNDEDDGCHVSGAKGFILLFLALVVAVGVGIIVHFAGNNREFSCNCRCTPEDGATGYLSETCRASAIVGNQALCGLCPKPVPTTKPTVALTTTRMTTVETTEAPPTTPPPGPIRDVRLPTSIKPLHYNIKIRPELYNNKPDTFTFSGVVHITVECLTSTDNITLHIASQNLTSTPTVLPKSDVTEVAPQVTNTTRDVSARQFLILWLDKPLATGHTYDIKLEFADHLSDHILLGMYISTYKTEGSNDTSYLAVTQFEPTYARHTFPCFDEPALKATFTVTLERQPHIISLSTMPINQTVVLGDGYVADMYEESVVMPTYLLAFVFGDFRGVKNKTVSNTEFGVYATPENMNNTAFALRTGSMLLDAFENYFNLTFALPKVDNIALPDFVYGAMENWGLMTYRDVLLLYEEGLTTTADMELITEVIAHEIVHSWFGNLVSPAWWDDIWLSEGFATFLSFLGMDLVYPEWHMMDLINVYVIQAVMEVDTIESITAVYREANTPDEILSLFEIITYYKGCAVIRMMWFFLGPDTFRRGLEGYQKEMSYGSVTHDDLWAALQREAVKDGRTDLDVKSVMDSWITQTNYPVVTVRRANGGVYLSQNRFLAKTDNTTDSSGYSWKIPFTYTTNQEMDFNKTANDIVWMEPNTEVYAKDSSISTANGWVLGNIQHYGYFRVNYDKDNWDALVQQLKTDHEKIHVVNRGTLITDAWALSKAGLMDPTTAWDMLIYLRQENEFIPWSYATSELAYPRRMLISSPAFGNFERFMIKLLEGRALNVSLNDNRPTQERSLSQMIFSLSCIFGIEECNTRATAMFDDWKNKGKLIPPDVKSTVLCTAVRNGGEEEWNYIYDRYLNGPITDRPLALDALGCTDRLWIISRFLDYTLIQNKVRKQDVNQAFRSLLRNAFYPTFEFILRKWKYMVTDYEVDVNTLNDIIGYVSAGMYRDHDIKKIENWRDDVHPEDGPTLHGFDQALEKIAVNMEWHSKYYDLVADWLENNV